MTGSCNNAGQQKLNINIVEDQLDTEFADNNLKTIGYAQSMWTLLSVNEDQHLFSYMHDKHEMFIQMLNIITYPLRICHKENTNSNSSVEFSLEMIDEHYKLAMNWLDSARHYYSFCCIFPLWHQEKITVDVEGKKLLVRELSKNDKQYEAYNTLIAINGPKDIESSPIDFGLSKFIRLNTTVYKDRFKLNFNPALVNRLFIEVEKIAQRRQDLPSDWSFNGFSIAEYRKVFCTIQAMLYGWHLARLNVVDEIDYVGYKSGVWVVSYDELVMRLKRYTGLSNIQIILNVITFGSSAIRDPDIAIQPLVDLRNGFYALSPFVWMSTNTERNLCVLLNQIPSNKVLYDKLKNEKETLLKIEIKNFLSSFEFEYKEVQLNDTDVDIAIISRREKACLCLELKWFIEPAEIREVISRSKELSSGVIQALRIKAAYDDGRLNSKLNITPDYLFLSAVASQNWIGHSDIQDDEIPIIKVWHLMQKILEFKSLSTTIKWLKDREYLPQVGIDYEVNIGERTCGSWKTSWYGINPTEKH